MPRHSKLLFLTNNLNKQQGQALLALLVLLTVGAGAAFYTLVRPSSSVIERDKITIAALEQAKTALIGYAAGVGNLAGGDRPGDLPCPDANDTGAFGGSCNTQASRIGRLPWKRLGLHDLRDGDGERLWYAVSTNFKMNTRTACAAPGDAGCLNSDTRGTITVRNSAGTVIHDGANPDPFTPSGVIAVIIAPGAVLQRQGAAAAQIRDCSGAGCVVATGACNSTATAKCDPLNYLDVLSGVEDNADFVDGSNSNGFIHGRISSAGGNLIVNDRVLTITYADLMPLVQRRVAKEALNCLNTYASIPQNGGRYPWAAPVGNYPSFADQTNTRFGRMPDGPFSATLLGLGGSVTNLICSLTPALCMFSDWPASCGLTQGTWWNNWKDMVFYGVAQAYQPADSLLGVPASTGCGLCLTVNPPSSLANKRVVVAVAGKRLSVAAYPAGNNQPRTSTANKQSPTNYLEGDNDNNATSSIYEQQPNSASFSDFLLYQ